MNIFIFGDSYSVDYDSPCLKLENQLNYPEWKGYVPKKYYNLIADYFKVDKIHNYSLCGNDNPHIFHNFLNVYKSIHHEDIIIFNWSLLERFTVPNHKTENELNDGWGSCVSHSSDWAMRAKSNFSTFHFYKRQIKLIEFLNDFLKSNKVIHCHWRFENYEHPSTIFYETNGKVNDYHYNENQHKILAERILTELKLSHKVHIDLWNPKNVSEINYAIID